MRYGGSEKDSSRTRVNWDDIAIDAFNWRAFHVPMALLTAISFVKHCSLPVFHKGRTKQYPHLQGTKLILNREDAVVNLGPHQKYEAGHTLERLFLHQRDHIGRMHTRRVKKKKLGSWRFSKKVTKAVGSVGKAVIFSTSTFSSQYWNNFLPQTHLLSAVSETQLAQVLPKTPLHWAAQQGLPPEQGKSGEPNLPQYLGVHWFKLCFTSTKMSCIFLCT